MYSGHQRLQRCLYGRKIFAIQICRAYHLRFALFIYAKHTIKIEKSQSRLQATLHRRAHGLHSLRPHSPAEPMAPFRRASSAPSPPGEGTLPSNVPQPTRFHKHQAFSTQGEGRPRSGGDSQGSRKCKVNYFTFSSFSFLTLPMPKGRGFLVRRPMRRLRGIGVLHDLPKREFPCAPRYVLFPFMQLWICLPKLCAGCSLRHSHLCRDGFHTQDNPTHGHSNLWSVSSGSHKQSTFDLTGRTYRP